MNPLPANPAWFDALPLPMGLVRDGRIAGANPAYLRLVGRPQEEVIGKSFDAFLAQEDQERIRERYARRLRGESVPATYEAAVVRPSGERRTVEVFIGTSADTTIVQLHDVTERHQRQSHLLALARLGTLVQREQTDQAIFQALASGFEVMNVGMLRLEPDGDGVRVVQAFAPAPFLEPLATSVGIEVLQGRRPWTSDLSQAWSEGFAYVDDQPLDAVRYFGEAQGAIVRDALVHAGWHRGVILRLDAQGRRRELLHLLTTWAEPGDLPALALFGAQVSAALDAARAIQHLREAQEQLVAQERLAALGEMAAAVAHEVRNPLGVIFNSVGHLRRELGTGPSSSALDILTEESERINHLVGDLLDFARPTQPVLSEAVALRPLVEEAVGSVVRAPGSIAVEVRSPEPLPDVSMDARLMRQVFVNLATNAAQAMPQGGRLTIVLGREERQGQPWAAVEFRDDGPGIPPAILPRIFQPFFTTRAQGTGLGLALVKRIMDSHRGEVEVRSVPDEGASFTVRWPLT